MDDDFEITVILQLPEAVPLDQVRGWGVLFLGLRESSAEEARALPLPPGSCCFGLACFGMLLPGLLPHPTHTSGSTTPTLPRLPTPVPNHPSTQKLTRARTHTHTLTHLPCQTQVRTRFEERSLEMWAVGEAAAYRLYIPRLYSRVITKRCKAKVFVI